MQKTIFSIVITLLSMTLIAQNVSNIRIHQMDHVLIIIYDLTIQADIEVYASFDGGVTFSEPLQHVIGAVGKGVTPDTDKMIVWNVLDEFGEIDYPNTVVKIVSSDEVGNAKIDTATATKSTFFSEGKEINFHYPGPQAHSRIFPTSSMVVLTLDKEILVISELSKGFSIKIKDPNPGQRRLRIYSYHIDSNGRIFRHLNWDYQYRINTLNKNVFEFRPNMTLKR